MLVNISNGTIIINSIQFITYWTFVTFLGKTIDSLEKYFYIGTRVGIDYRSDWSRLGFVHHNYRFAQVYEVGVALFNSRGIILHLILISHI